MPDNVIDKLSIEVVSETSKAVTDIGAVVAELKKLSTTLEGIKMPKMGMGLSRNTAENLQKVANVIYGLKLDKLKAFSDATSGIRIRIGINDKTADNLKTFEKAIKDFDLDKLREFGDAASHVPTLKLGISENTSLNIRSLSAALHAFPVPKLAEFGAISKYVQPLNTGVRADTGDNIRSLGNALRTFDVNKLAAFGGISKTIQPLHLGIGDATGKNLDAFSTALNNLNVPKLAQLSTVNLDNLKSVSNVAHATSGLLALAKLSTPGSAASLSETFRVLERVNPKKLARLGAASKDLKSFAGLASFSKIGGEKLKETFEALDNVDLSRLYELSRIDFSNMRDLADAFRMISKLNERVKASSSAHKNLASATRSVSRHTRGAAHSFSLAHTALGKFFNSVKRIVFYRAIRSALRAITQGFGEGIENLYRWSQAWGTSFAPAMDQLKTAQTYLKNGFASMFSPLIEYAVPIIDTVIDRIVDMFNAIQELFAQLTGAATWNKAIKYPVKYKDDLDAAAGSAKALQNILMDFDEINAINTPNEGGRGSGKEVEDYSKMFELVQTSTKSDSALSRFADFLKQLDFTPLKDSLKRLWDEGLSPIVNYFKKNGDKFLSPLVKFFVEEGLPTAIDLVTASLKPLLSIIQPLLDSGFMEDVAGKLSKVNGIVKDFADFLGTLDFGPLGEALSSLWNNALSPIIDRLIETAGWIQEKVIKPITQFLVEKGIPAAIGVIEEALRAIWSIISPILDGLKSFWERNGSWIMKLFEEHTMEALGKIKDAFKSIGDFFTGKGSKISGIIENIGIIVEKIAPVISKLLGMIGTHALDTFVDSIRNILSSLAPIIDLLSGIFNIIGGLVSGDWGKVKNGLKDIGMSLWDTILFPIKIIIRALATILDVIGHIAPGAKDIAHQLRVMIGDEVDAQKETEELHETANKLIYGTLAGMGDVANEIEEVDELYENRAGRIFNRMRYNMNNFLRSMGVTASMTADQAASSIRASAEEAAAVTGNSLDEIRHALGKSEEETITVLDVITSYYQMCETYGVDPLISATEDLGNTMNEIDTSGINSIEEAALNGKRALQEAKDAGIDTFWTWNDWANYCRRYGLDPLTSEIFTVEGALKTIDATPFKTIEDAAYYAQLAIGMIDDEAKDSFIHTTEWITYCNTYGLDPLTGKILEVGNQLVDMTNGVEEASRKVIGPVTAAADRIYKVFEDKLNQTTGEKLGFKMGEGFSAALQSALERTRFSAKINIEEVTHQTLIIDKKMENIMYKGQKLAFASGGFPPMSTGSLFVAGEGGVPELMGTVGGRTAVAGGAEITGIRQAIEAQGQAEQGLLRQMIAAIQNKDLTLVANSKTGRWVNQAMRAYAGVTG